LEHGDLRNFSRASERYGLRVRFPCRLLIDIIRDLKRIAAHLASVAHSVLDKNGLLLRSRVATDNARDIWA
jgi:phosphate:Na+ symporter